MNSYPKNSYPNGDNTDNHLAEKHPGLHPITPQRLDRYWQAVRRRERGFDRLFVYAVTSTGIYCLPSCPSRKPDREHVEFFPLPELARQAGYRPCKRCHPETPEDRDPRVVRMHEVCLFIERNLETSLTLELLGQRFQVNPHHLQRTFTEVIGISPREYADACRMSAVRTALRRGEDISGALYQAGFGSSSRLYSRAARSLGMTPGSYRRGGAGIGILYTVTPCLLGWLLVAATELGICTVHLGDDAQQLAVALREEFGRAAITRDDDALAVWVAAIVEHLQGKRPHLELPLDVQATAFQRQVWKELQAIPYGQTRSYSDVATAIGRPGAARAVARACASNPTALVVPCHRVIRSDGSPGGYRWGLERKEKLLERERG